MQFTEAAIIYYCLLSGFGLFGTASYILNLIPAGCTDNSLQNSVRGLLIISSVMITAIISFLMCHYRCGAAALEQAAGGVVDLTWAVRPSTIFLGILLVISILCVVATSLTLQNLSPCISDSNMANAKDACSLSLGLFAIWPMVLSLGAIVYRMYSAYRLA
jgi:hypothetical protein